VDLPRPAGQGNARTGDVPVGARAVNGGLRCSPAARRSQTRVALVSHDSGDEWRSRGMRRTSAGRSRTLSGRTRARGWNR
jgi:hypothetical protein